MYTKVNLLNKRIIWVVIAAVLLPVILSGADFGGAPAMSSVTPGPNTSARPSAGGTPGTSSTPTATVMPTPMPTPTPTPQAPLLKIERLSFRSRYLGKKMKVNVYLPADYDTTQKYPVLYLLHGYGANESVWENSLNLVSTASELFFSGAVDPYIIVTPDIENSYGVNSSLPEPEPSEPPVVPTDTPVVPTEGPAVTESTGPAASPTEAPTNTPEPTPEATETPAPTNTPEPTPGVTETPAPSSTPAITEIEFVPSYGNYENYLIKELIPYIDSNYSTVAAKEGRYIGGVSMGGFAALHICFAHTKYFSKAGGHSPALWIYSTDPMETNNVIMWLYPSDKLRRSRDPLLQAKRADLSGIKVWLDCGKSDRFKFYQGTKKLYDILVSRGAQAEYNAFTGGHSVDYWKTHIKEYLTFYGS